MSSLYEQSHRNLQDEHDTRRLADRLQSLAHAEFDDTDREFIATASIFFLASVNSDGMPTVSYKGGAPGFVRISAPNELIFPVYDGNGMFLSLGNIVCTRNVGLLFIDFQKPRRLRVQGTATRVDDATLLTQFPGAQHLTRVVVSSLFVNCGRYIHPMELSGISRHVPDMHGKQPFPTWKRIDAIADSLSPTDQQAVKDVGGTVPLADYRGEN